MSHLKFRVWNLWKQSARINTMAKKKSSPKKTPAPKKVRSKKDCEVKKSDEVVQEVKAPEFELKPLTKADYFFGMIKKAFGYE